MNDARTTVEVIGLCFSVFMALFSGYISWTARGLQIMNAATKAEIQKDLAAIAVDVAVFKAGLAEQATQVKLDLAAKAAELALKVAEEAGRIRFESAQNRMDDREEIKRWINGSFMRAGEISARLDSLYKSLRGLLPPDTKA